MTSPEVAMSSEKEATDKDRQDTKESTSLRTPENPPNSFISTVNGTDDNTPTPTQEKERSVVINMDIPSEHTDDSDQINDNEETEEESKYTKQETVDENENDTKNIDPIENDTENVNEENEKDDEKDDYDPELLITDEERDAFAFMLEQRREELAKQRQNFQNWVDSLTRRRMFALSRIRKINKGHKDRMEFYDKIDKYIHSADSIISPSAQNGHPDTESRSESENQKFEELVRENTGFVLTSPSVENKDKMDGPKSNDSSNSASKPKDTNSTKPKNNSNQELPNGNHDNDSNQSISDKNLQNTPKIVPVNS